MGSDCNVIGFFKWCQTLIRKKRNGSLCPRNRRNPEPQAAFLGKRLVKDLSYQDVKDLHRKTKKGGHETNANRAVPKRHPYARG